MRDRSRRWLPWLALAAVVIGFANFTWFFAESSTIGDAQRGYVRDGRYYLAHAGVAVEVTRERWDWSRLHGTSLVLTHPLAMVGGAYLLLTVVFPSMLGGGDPIAKRERVARIRSSGTALASTRTGGKIGELRATKPLVRADVHPGGLIIEVIGGAPVGIEAASLSGVESGRKFGTTTIRVVHVQADTPADIRLYLDAASPVAQALRSLVPNHASEATSSAPTKDPTDSSPAPYPAAMKAAIIVGMALSVIFLVVMLPFGRQLGGFGIIWSIGLVFIFAYNLWTYFIRNRRRW